MAALALCRGVDYSLVVLYAHLWLPRSTWGLSFLTKAGTHVLCIGGQFLHHHQGRPLSCHLTSAEKG